VGSNPGILASELAAVLHLHRATLSGIVRRLRTSGYLEGTVNQRDGRRVSLTLTESGRAINRQRAGTFEEAVRRLVASTSRSDRVTTERVLSRLGAELRAIAEPHEAP
jgi:DNA-binding MarR family transcriptional regulator